MGNAGENAGVTPVRPVGNATGRLGVAYAAVELPQQLAGARVERDDFLRSGVGIKRFANDDWFAVYVETPDEESGRIKPETYAILQENISFARTLGAKVVKLKGNNVSDALLNFTRENQVTHVIFGQSARTRWEIFWKGSIINRFLREAKDATVHVIPLEKT